MKKLLKIIFYTVVILLVLCVLGSFLVIHFINPNDYKNKITQLVHEETGRDLVIGGEINLSFFPWLGVRVHEVKLSNAKGFSPEDFASAGEADVRVKLMPLLSRQVEVGRITLRNLALNLAKNKQGVTNWDDLGAASNPSQSAKTTASTAVATPKKSDAMLLSIAGVDIEKSSISWVDAQKNQTAILTNVEIKSDQPGMNRSFPFKLAFDVKSTKPDVRGHVAVSCDVLLDQNKATYQLKDLRVDFSPPQKEINALSFQANRVLLDVQAQTLSIAQGVLSQGDSSAHLNVQAEKILDNPVFQGELNATQFNVKELLRVLNQSGATDSKVLERVSFQTQFVAGASSIKLNPFNADIYKGTMRGKIVIDLRGAAPKFNIDETLSNIDMTQLLQSGRVLGQANVEAHLTFQGKNKADIMQSLNGNVRFNVQNGALMGKNIPYEVERAVALLKRQPAPEAPAAMDRTNFGVLQGTGTFNAGVFSNNDLLIQSPEFKGTGSGTANLTNETLNYRLRLVGLQIAVDAAGKSVAEERKTPIPVAITGTFDKPIITPDLQVLIQDELGKKTLEQIEEKLGPDAGKALGGFLEMLQK